MADRLIFHIDVNSAYLSWTALSLLEKGHEPDLRLVPSIIGGDISKRHGVVFAKSIPAKAYGINTGEPVVNAFRKCPHLIAVPPDHGIYDQRSRQLMDHLMDINPNMEQVSVDECYMDYTPVSHKYTSPEAAAATIKDGVYEKFGFTVNIGISDRKVLAKMASDFKKPDMVHTLYSWEIQEKLWPLPVSSLYMCGRSSGEVFKKLGILTIGDLARSEPAILEGHLKSHGLTLWNYANGHDDSEVFSEPSKLKGIGNSITLQADALKRKDAEPVLLHLAESVSRRLDESHELAGLVCTEIKYATFRSVSHQTTLEIPTASSKAIYRSACELFDRLWDGTPIRLLGIRTSKLVPDSEPVQLSLFDLVPTVPKAVKQQKAAAAPEPEPDKQQEPAAVSKPMSDKQQKLESALKAIRNKYGENAVKKGSMF